MSRSTRRQRVSNAFWSRSASGGSPRNRSTQLSTSRSRASSSTARLTSPQRSASAPSIDLPPSRSSAVRPQPTRPGRSAAWITDGIPTVISGMPSRHEAAAIRRSHASTSSRAPPSTWPWRRAIVGTGTSSSARMVVRSAPMSVRAPAASRSLMAATSTPAENARPAPSRTTTRRVGSAPSSRKAAPEDVDEGGREHVERRAVEGEARKPALARDAKESHAGLVAAQRGVHLDGPAVDSAAQVHGRDALARGATGPRPRSAARGGSRRRPRAPDPARRRVRRAGPWE